MARLQVIKVTGPYCGTRTEAAKLCLAVEPILIRGESAELDFENVELASSSFFNELFGQLIERFGDHCVSERLMFLSLKKRLEFVLKRTRALAANTS